MKLNPKQIALAALLLAATTALAFADIPGPGRHGRPLPPQNRSVGVFMKISPDEDAKEARLIIPRSIWQEMRAGLDGDDSARSAASLIRFFDMSGPQTVMAGLFLSLSIAFGGIWFVRHRRARPQLTGALLGTLLVTACGTVASIAYANAGPPPSARSLTSRILAQDLQWWGASGPVKIEITDEGEQITLILPKVKEGK